jgi:hypothetical protein
MNTDVFAHFYLSAVELRAFVCGTFSKHISMPQRKCRKFCKIYSCIISALKEVEAFRMVGSAPGK